MYETPEMEEIKLKMEGALLNEGASTEQGKCPVECATHQCPTDCDEDFG